MKSAKIFALCLLVIGAMMAAPLAHAQVAISEDGVTFPGDPEPVWALKQYAIADRGPANGWVFYVTDDGLHGLEAAPEDQGVGTQWGCINTNIAGANATAIGTGASNTEAIIQGCETAGIAAAVAAEYESPTGYFDWYLPSEDELDLMYDNIGLGNTTDPNVGGFCIDINSCWPFYWSSTEISNEAAGLVDFRTGQKGSTDKNWSSNLARAVRAF